jgi:ubiquinone/menaquinone biosynthesis C-methylase UbiE
MNKIKNTLEKKEIERIREAYMKRKKLIGDKYSLFIPANQFMFFQREKEILKILMKYDLNQLRDKKILDLGCGDGAVLRNFIQYGASPENLYGIDLLEDKIELAKKLSPHIDFCCGNAEKLPYDDKIFNVILSFTVFTSILDTEMKKNIAKEMLRVLKNDGIIIWYDYHMNNPKNPDVKGVKKKEIYSLFPNCCIWLRRITLAPPLTRLIAPYSWIICYLLEKIPILCSHYLGIIRKQN